jgi:hypothetical protein
MRVYEVRQFGIENLVLAERAEPQPRANGQVEYTEIVARAEGLLERQNAERSCWKSEALGSNGADIVRRSKT